VRPSGPMPFCQIDLQSPQCGHVPAGGNLPFCGSHEGHAVGLPLHAVRSRVGAAWATRDGRRQEAARARRRAASLPQVQKPVLEQGEAEVMRLTCGTTRENEQTGRVYHPRPVLLSALITRGLGTAPHTFPFRTSLILRCPSGGRATTKASRKDTVRTSTVRAGKPRSR
jgi:hypothetical protein